MKSSIKVIAYLNRFIVITTLILYLTVYFGLYAQVVLGGFQVLSFIVLLFFIKEYCTKERRLLFIYFLVVTAYFLGWLILKERYSFDSSFSLMITGIIMLPMLISFYFTYIIETLHKKR